MTYTIVEKRLNDGRSLFYHTNDETSEVTILLAGPDNAEGTEVTGTNAASLESTVGVAQTIDINTSHPAHRFGHHFNVPKGQYLCYTSQIQDSENTVLYYIVDQSTDEYVVFKTNNSNPNGVVIDMDEINYFLTNFTNNGIPTVPSNLILKQFGHLLSSIM